jgi:transposase
MRYLHLLYEELPLRPQQPINDAGKKSLQKLLKKTRNKDEFLRVQCVWLRAEFGFNSNMTAKIIGWSAATVRKIWTRYLKEGEESLKGTGRGGRRRQYLTYEDEKIFLGGLFKKTGCGRDAVASEIKQAYEEKINRIVPKSTIYRLLARHGWRKEIKSKISK